MINEKEYCISFLDDIKKHANVIELRSRDFKHLGLYLTKEWILEKQSKIRERLHTGVIGFTEWCYKCATDFYAAPSGKFRGFPILAALDAVQNGDSASEMDIRQIVTVFNNIFQYDELRSEDEKTKTVLTDIEFYEYYRNIILYPPRTTDGRLKIDEIPLEVQKFCERHKGKIQKRKIEDTDSMGKKVTSELEMLIGTIFPKAAFLYRELIEQQKADEEIERRKQ